MKRIEGDPFWEAVVSKAGTSRPTTTRASEDVDVDRRTAPGFAPAARLADAAVAGFVARVLEADAETGPAHETSILRPSFGRWTRVAAAGLLGTLSVAGAAWVVTELWPEKRESRETMSSTDAFALLVDPTASATTKQNAAMRAYALVGDSIDLLTARAAGGTGEVAAVAQAKLLQMRECLSAPAILPAPPSGDLPFLLRQAAERDAAPSALRVSRIGDLSSYAILALRAARFEAADNAILEIEALLRD